MPRAWGVPSSGRNVVEPNEIHLLTRAVFRNPQQIGDARKAGFASEIVGNLALSHRHNRIDDDVTLIHRVAATDFDMRALPDANARPNSSAPDALAKRFGEDHRDAS